MAKRNQLSRGEIAAVDDARVVLSIAKDGVAILGQGDECALVGKKSGGKKNRRIAPEEIRKCLLKFHMELDRSVQQAGPCAAGAVFFNRLAGCLDHAGILSQAEVVIRPDHDLPLAFADHIIAMWFFDGSEVGVETLRSRISRVAVIAAFLKDVFRCFRHLFGWVELHQH